MAFRGDYRGDVTTVLFIQPKQCDISILILAFGPLRKACWDQELIACFNDLIDVNRLSRYVRAPIIITIIILSTWSTLFTPSKDKFACTGLRNIGQKLFDHGYSIAFIGLQSLAFLEGHRPVPEMLVLLPFHRGQA